MKNLQRKINKSSDLRYLKTYDFVEASFMILQDHLILFKTI